jgi:LPXTG-motif cell wall-anchored protein
MSDKLYASSAASAKSAASSAQSAAKLALAADNTVAASSYTSLAASYAKVATSLGLNVVTSITNLSMAVQIATKGTVTATSAYTYGSAGTSSYVSIKAGADVTTGASVQRAYAVAVESYYASAASLAMSQASAAYVAAASAGNVAFSDASLAVSAASSATVLVNSYVAKGLTPSYGVNQTALTAAQASLASLSAVQSTVASDNVLASSYAALAANSSALASTAAKLGLTGGNAIYNDAANPGISAAGAMTDATVDGKNVVYTIKDLKLAQQIAQTGQVAINGADVATGASVQRAFAAALATYEKTAAADTMVSAAATTAVAAASNAATVIAPKTVSTPSSKANATQALPNTGDNGEGALIIAGVALLAGATTLAAFRNKKRV